MSSIHLSVNPTANSQMLSALCQPLLVARCDKKVAWAFLECAINSAKLVILQLLCRMHIFPSPLQKIVICELLSIKLKFWHLYASFCKGKSAAQFYIYVCTNTWTRCRHMVLHWHCWWAHSCLSLQISLCHWQAQVFLEYMHNIWSKRCPSTSVTLSGSLFVSDAYELKCLSSNRTSLVDPFPMTRSWSSSCLPELFAMSTSTVIMIIGLYVCDKDLHFTTSITVEIPLAGEGCWKMAPEFKVKPSSIQCEDATLWTDLAMLLGKSGPHLQTELGL